MSSRTITTLVIAVLLIFVIMIGAAALTYFGWVGAEKFEPRLVWNKPYREAQSMKIIDLTGDGQDDLFIQNSNNLSMMDTAGAVFFSHDTARGLVTTMGDVNRDGVEDIIAATSDGAVAILEIFNRGELINRVEVSTMGEPTRIAIIQFPSGPQIILGDFAGNLAGFSPDGAILWQGNLSSGDYIRGLDDALVDGQVWLAAANHDGSVALLDAQGQSKWTYNLAGGIRRLRAYDLNGDGASEILLGGERGQFVVLDASSGGEIFSFSLGQPVSEIREVETDGDPSSREIVVGGKEGGVWVYKIDGTKLWSSSFSDKVTEISGVDIDGDGVEEVIIGDDSGRVALFEGVSGDRNDLESFNSGIARIDVGRLSDARQVAIADQSGVSLYSVEYSSVPAFKYLPLLAGLIASVVILVAAWFIATNPPKPVIKAAIQDQSAESLKAQRRMLKENIADVERLKASGEISAEAYLIRLKQLRGQLADNETAMKKAGVPFTPETFQCPNCGGSLLLGLDKCDYCGQIVLT